MKWYKGSDGKFYRQSDVEMAMFIVTGEEEIDISKCKGIEKVLDKAPEWLELAEAGQTVLATTALYNRQKEMGIQPQLSLRECREEVVKAYNATLS